MQPHTSGWFLDENKKYAVRVEATDADIAVYADSYDAGNILANYIGCCSGFCNGAASITPKEDGAMTVLFVINNPNWSFSCTPAVNAEGVDPGAPTNDGKQVSVTVPANFAGDFCVTLSVLTEGGVGPESMPVFFANTIQPQGGGEPDPDPEPTSEPIQEELAVYDFQDTGDSAPVRFTYEGQTYYAAVGCVEYDANLGWKMQYVDNGECGIQADATDPCGQRFALGFFIETNEGYQEVDAETYGTLASNSDLSYRLYASSSGQTAMPKMFTQAFDGRYDGGRSVSLLPENGGTWVLVLSGTLPDGTTVAQKQVATTSLRVLLNSTYQLTDEDEDPVAQINELLDAIAAGDQNGRGTKYTFQLPAGEFSGVIYVPEMAAEVEILGADLDGNGAPTTILNGGVIACNDTTLIRRIAFKGEGKDQEERTGAPGERNCAITGRVNNFSNCTFTGYYYAVYSGPYDQMFGNSSNIFTGNKYAIYVDWQSEGGGNLNMSCDLLTNNECGVYFRNLSPSVPINLYTIQNCAFVDNGVDIDAHQLRGDRYMFLYGNHFSHTGGDAYVVRGKVFVEPYYSTYTITSGPWVTEGSFSRDNLVYGNSFNYANGKDWGGLQNINVHHLAAGMELNLWVTNGDTDEKVATITFDEEG